MKMRFALSLAFPSFDGKTSQKRGKVQDVTGVINFIEISDFLNGDTTGIDLFFGLCLG